MQAEILIIGEQSEDVGYWGVRREALEEDDPPVLATPSGPSGWEVESELDWTPGHAHLSGFLDDLTYHHAFCGGALHGAWTDLFLYADPPAHQFAWLEENWHKATAGPMVFGLSPDPPSESSDSTSDRWPTLYVREGQALHWTSAWCLAAREAEVVDEISQRFQIRGWAKRW